MSNNHNLVISYLSLREAIGFLGISLPVVLWLGGYLSQGQIQPSISHFYHSSMRDIFVGYLFAISVFLMAYRGYEPVDMWCGKIAGLSGIGVALMPTIPGLEKCIGESLTDGARLLSKFHYVSASVFFLTLAFFCFFLFTKSKEGAIPTPMKLWRNRVYRACGSIILLCIAVLAVLMLTSDGECYVPVWFPPVYTLESIAVFAFGFSWIVKGEAILKD